MAPVQGSVPTLSPGGVPAGCWAHRAGCWVAGSHVTGPWSPRGHGRDTAVTRSLEISCLETSVEVEALILRCSRGMGGNIWARVATSGCLLPSHGAPSILHPPRTKSIPSPEYPPVPGAARGTQSTMQSPGRHPVPRHCPAQPQHPAGTLLQGPVSPRTAVVPSTPGSCDATDRGPRRASPPQPSPRGAAVTAQGPVPSTNLLLKPKRDFGAFQYKLINFYVLINGSY